MRSRWSLRRNTLRRTCSPLSIKIATKLAEDGWISGIPQEYCIRRTYAGYDQKSAGAWLWTLELINLEHRHHPDWTAQIGSQWPASELARKGFDVISEYGNIVLWPKEIQ